MREKAELTAIEFEEDMAQHREKVRTFGARIAKDFWQHGDHASS